MINKIINEINSYNKVLILGYGREGKSTYNLIRTYLKEKKLYIADINNSLLDINPELHEDKNIEFILGDNYLDNLDQFDLIIKSPGINFKNIDYSKIVNKITSQIDLFLRYHPCKTVGITGTKGKSTTSSLIYYVLSNMGKKVLFGGNIGLPVFDKINDVDENTIYVMELSCHQLQFVKSSPNIGVLLNIHEEHLDLYKTYKDYIDAKLNIFKYQKEDDYKIWGLDSKEAYNNFKETNNTYTYSSDSKKVINGILIKEDGLYENNNLIYSSSRKRNLLGHHNLYNIAAAILVFKILGLDINKCSDFIDNFKGLEHRMERVGTFNGITFYNDSIATIPLATINCIKSVDNISTIIIGGMDRKIDLSDLINYLNNEDKKIDTCIFLKDTGYIICDALEKLGCVKRLIKVENMKEAVTKAYEYTKEGMACALSPAAASYNTYKNFEERGNDYKRWIKDLSNQK